jgi:predicted SAM-dependent methyltransferase
MKFALNLGSGDRTFTFYPHRAYKCINLDYRFLKDKTAIVADVKALPFKNETFDYVLASDIIEHFTIKETKNLLLEWQRVLKPNGILEIRTPNLTFLAIAYVKGLTDHSHPHPADFFSYHAFGGQDYPGNFHYVIFDRSWLSIICKECGLHEFEYEEIHQNFIMKVRKI